MIIIIIWVGILGLMLYSNNRSYYEINDYFLIKSIKGCEYRAFFMESHIGSTQGHYLTSPDRGHTWFEKGNKIDNILSVKLQASISHYQSDICLQDFKETICKFESNCTIAMLSQENVNELNNSRFRHLVLAMREFEEYSIHDNKS